MTDLRPKNALSHWLYGLLLFALALSAYAVVIEVYFIKDDLSLRGTLCDEAGAFDAKTFTDQLLWPKAREWDDIWRPLPALSWAIDYLLFGPNPIAFHLVNFLLHALNGVLVYRLLLRLMRGTSALPAFAGAAAFALWPLHPEAVVWTTQRTVVMGFCFCLAALLSYDRWLEDRKPRHRLFAYFAFTAALLSREHALALPSAFVFLALFFGPKRPFRRRALDILEVTIIGSLILAAYFGLRFAIFGRLTGGYSGFKTMAAYSDAFRIFERLSDTLRYCFVPINPEAQIGSAALKRVLPQAYAILQLLLLAGTLVHAAFLGRRGRKALSLFGFAILFSLGAWLPVAQVFYVEANLINSRSGYHLTGLLVATLFCILAIPGKDGEARLWRRVRIGLLSLGLFAQAAVLQNNLQAFVGAGHQVQEVRLGLRKFGEEAPEKTAFLVLESPAVHKGVPTIDAYLPQLLAPPYVAKRLPVLPLVAGQMALWPSGLLIPIGQGLPPGLSALERQFQTTKREFLRADPLSGKLKPLFGASEPPLGTSPPRLQAPLDGEIFLAGADGSVKCPAGAEVFGLRKGLFAPSAPPSGASIDAVNATMRWPIREGETVAFAADLPKETASIELVLEVPGRRLVLQPELARDAKGHPTLAFRLGIDPLTKESAPFPWPLPRETFRFGFPVQWRVAAKDNAGRLLGVSASRRFVLFDLMTPP